MSLPEPYYTSPDGRIVIYCADCRDVLPYLEAGSVDLVLTDPPYAKSGSRPEWKTTAAVAIGLNQAARLVKPKGALLALTTTSGRGMDFTREAIGNVLPFNRLLIWHKEFVRSRVAGPWRWDAVSVMAFGRASFGRPQFSSVFRSTGPASRKHLGDSGHPAELPPGLADWLYCPFDAEGVAVVDPFMGVGTLLGPAIRQKRRAIGIEIEEKYCEIAVQRLAQEVLPLDVSA